MEDEKLSLSNEIETIVSNRSFKALSEIGIRTLADLLSVNIAVLANQRTIGKKIINEIGLVIKQYSYLREEIKKDYSKYDEINKFGIEYFSSLMSKRLLHKLAAMGIYTLNDVLRLKIEDFARKDGIGESFIGDYIALKRTINNYPEDVVRSLQESIEPRLPTKASSEAMSEIITASIKELCKKADEKREWEVVKKRYGFDDSRQYTLDDIGVYFGITRERVRQIQEKILKKYRILLNDLPLKKPRARLCRSIIDKNTEYKEYVDNNQFISMKEFARVIDVSCIEGKIFPVCRFLADIYELKTFVYGNVEYYISNKEINCSILQKICSTAEQLLKEKILPITEFDLIIEIRKRQKSRTLNIKYVDYALLVIGSKELIINGEKLYQIDFGKLSSIADKAFIILHQNGSPMHFRELNSKIIDENIKLGDNKRPSDHSLSNQLVNDSRFVPIGRTGGWSLRQWEINRDSMLDLIKRVLKNRNAPLAFEEILNDASTLRSDIEKSKLMSVFYLNKDHFYYVNNDKIILKEWSERYPDKRTIGQNSKSRKIAIENTKMYKIEQEILQIMSNNKNGNRFLSEVVIEVAKSQNAPKATVYAVINKMDSIKKDEENGKCKILLASMEKKFEKEEELKKIITKGESKTVEFKSTLRWDIKEEKTNKELEFVVARAIASFLNSNGGVLLIGVTDNGEILGIENDLSTLSKKNFDGFSLALNNVINQFFDKDIHEYITVYSMIIDEKCICKIEIKKSRHFVYIRYKHDDLFFIRTSSGSQKLGPVDAAKYIQNHWSTN